MKKVGVQTVETFPEPRPSRAEAEEAVRVLLRWSGDDISREGLEDTPQRVVRAYEEYFRGYQDDPGKELARTFEDVGGYNDFVILRGIHFYSHCEHHIAPIVGIAHVGYLPRKRVVGLSKLSRVVDIFARRLQTQETMTVQIASAIDEALGPQGVGVVLEAEHTCMSTRGVRKKGVATVTRHFTGCLLDDRRLRQEFLDQLQG